VPSTIESILSRTAHALFKEVALDVRHSRFAASTAEFCAYIDEAEAVIYGRRFVRCLNEEVMIDVSREVASINEAINNKLFKKWKALQREALLEPR